MFALFVKIDAYCLGQCFFGRPATRMRHLAQSIKYQLAAAPNEVNQEAIVSTNDRNEL